MASRRDRDSPERYNPANFVTTTQILLMIGFYSVALVPAVYFTRAKVQRVLASLVAGTVFGVVALLGIVLGEGKGLWQMPRPSTSSYWALLLLGFAISGAVTYLMLWRVVRRFGTRGLLVCVLFSAIIGPPRDYFIVSRFPEWMTFAPGIAPVLADSAVYALLILIGHAVMRIVAGPAQSDALSRS
jgi:hypothetical protein